MSLLRQYIKEVLLTEAAKTLGNLPDNIFIAVDTGMTSKRVRFYYAVEETTPYETFSYRKALEAKDGISGIIEILRPPSSNSPRGLCGGAWEVIQSSAAHGWGPLLYDLAMEYATENGEGLMADRGSVSRSARDVWGYYMSSRSDVAGIQMDDLKNTLTPDDQDNCSQTIASYETRGEIPKTRDWQGSALSKRYTKPTSVMRELERKNKLVFV